jgi:ABC-type branched-subunit amino acid transport system substrate-binding protein
MKKFIKQLALCLCISVFFFFSSATSIDGFIVGNDSSRNVIGVLIPLSGKWESVGQKILKGIEMASNVFSSGQTPAVTYLIRDYGNNEDSIPGIIDELDRKHNVMALIGPVGEHAGEIACREAQVRNLPTIMFTQIETPAQSGSFCFRNFVTIEIQAKSLLNAARSMGITRFAVMSPEDRFGKTFSDVFIRMAPSYGITVLRTVTYPPQNVDFNQQVKAVLAVKKKAAGPPSKTPVKPDEIEAVLIPDSAPNAAMIASYIYPKRQNIRLFGPMLWDTPEFLKVGSRYVENAVFLSGFFNRSIMSDAQNFSQSFSGTFKYTPSIWEASAFDTASIIQDLLSAKSMSRPEFRDMLARIKGYHGVSGVTSFSSNGGLDKEIYTLTVKGGNVYEIHP